MISKKSTFILGIFVFLVPFMGLPTLWKTIFICFAGLFLVFSSITIAIPKKPIKHRVKKEKSSKMSIEGIAVYPKDNIISDMEYKESQSKNNIIE